MGNGLTGAMRRRLRSRRRRLAKCKGRYATSPALTGGDGVYLGPKGGKARVCRNDGVDRNTAGELSTAHSTGLRGYRAIDRLYNWVGDKPKCGMAKARSGVYVASGNGRKNTLVEV